MKLSILLKFISLLKILKKSPIEGAKESTALKNKITREAIETLEISEMVEE